MKKLFFVMAAVAALLTSCSKDDTFGGPTRGKVTFEVSTPELATRAYGDGTTADNLYYAVYDVIENAMVKTNYATDVVTIGDDLKATVTIDLVEGRPYEVAFWAESANSPYTFDADNKTVSYTNVNDLTANNENYDAFFAYVPKEDVKVGQVVNVVLKRPFAQLNIATNDTEKGIDDVYKALGVQVQTTGIEVKIYTSLNLATGTVDDEQTLTFTPAEIEKGTMGEIEAAGKKYNQLSMNYILANHTTADLVDVTLNFTDTKNKTYERSYTSVPVQRNFRTNILGSILTDPTKFDVEIRPGVEGTYDEERGNSRLVSDAQSLQEAINDPDVDVIVLDDDIDLNDLISLRDNSASLSTMTRAGEEQDPSVTIKENQVLTLDLNGFTLSATESATGSYGLININPGAELTINDSVGTGAIKLTATNDRDWNAYSSVISNQRGKLTVNGGTIEHLGGTDMAYGIDNLTNGKGTYAETIITGGTVKSTYRAIRQFLNGTEAQNILTVNGGTIEGTNKSIWMQNANASLNPGTLVVEKQAAIKGNVYISYSDAANDYISASVAAEALKDGSEVLLSNAPAGYAVKNIDGVWTVTKAASAAAFIDAVNNVEDGGTITLDSDIIFTEGARTPNGDTWYDGLYYIGDKSFTIDLNGYTICQDGAVNDYLLNFKNVGSKANTITIKNGTIDAGTAAYCALCCSTTQENKLTINLEGVTLYNNNSNGATIKWRGGAELNVKAGTKIIGKDSYVGIECWNSTVNIYDGAEIYQNGTSSYNGCLVGVSGNGTINVYGGYGKGVSGGFIAMTSGGTINVSGGEWIANTDGTYANSNKSVLVAQSEKGAKSIVNVTGGTFKGGYNCYGNAVGDAQINISGGNFNADPSNYLVEGYIAVEENGGWIVEEQILATTADMLQTLINGTDDIIYLGADLTLTQTLVIPEGKNITLDLNGKTITGTMHKDNGAVLNNKATLTIVGGTIKNTAENGEATIINEGDLTLSGAEIIGAPIGNTGHPSYALYTNGGKLVVEDNTKITSDRGAIYIYNGADVTINGGEIKVTNAVGSRTLTAHVIYAFGSSSKLTINDGNFTMNIANGGGTSVICPAGATIAVNGGYFYHATTADVQSGVFQNYMGYGAPVDVYGGTYNDKTVEKNLADGYKVVDNGNGTWSVVAE